MIKILNTLFVTMFGLGKLPKIPGTFGSLATIIILYILFHILNISSSFILLGLIVISVYSFSAIASYIEKNENKDQINLKGKTVEKLGLIGKEKAIACEVIISITKYD